MKKQIEFSKGLELQGRIEYNQRKLDEFHTHLQLMLHQHLAAASHFAVRYYFLAFPSIALSSFLAILTFVVPERPGCSSGGDGPAIAITTDDVGDLASGAALDPVASAPGLDLEGQAPR